MKRSPLRRKTPLANKTPLVAKRAMKSSYRPKPKDTKFAESIRTARICCEFCGSRANLECAHIFSRRYANTRHDPDNIILLCTTDHRYFHAHPAEFESWCRQGMGDEAYEALRAKARGIE